MTPGRWYNVAVKCMGSGFIQTKFKVRVCPVLVLAV